MEYKSPELTTFTCDDAEAHGSYPAINKLAAIIPNYNVYNLAEYLHLGKFSVCLSDEFLDQFEHCIVDNEPPFSVECFMLGTHKAVLTVYFNSVPIMSQSIIGDIEAVSGEIVQSYSLSVTQPLSGTGILINPRLLIRELAEEHTAFSGLINSYLDAITAQTHVEVADYTANARHELALMMSLAQVGVPPTTPTVPTPPVTPTLPVTPTAPTPPVEPGPPASPTTPEPPTTPVPPVTPIPPDVPAADARRMHLPLIER